VDPFLYDACVSDSGPFDDEGNDDFDFSDLFGASGDPNEMMSSIMKLFGGLGAGGGAAGLDSALQIAVSIAGGGRSEPNVDPVDRMALEQLVRVAELQIAQATGLRTSIGGPLTIAPVTKSDWVRKSMQAYKPVLEQLASAMASPDLGGGEGFEDDPQMAMFDQLFSSMRPMMINMTTGSMIGHMASRALGTYDLPIPRPGSNELLVVVPNLDAFGGEWSLDREELRLWIALSEVAHHAVLSIPHVAKQVSALLGRYTNAFRSDPNAIAESLPDFSPTGDMNDLADLQSQLQNMFGDPSALLGSMRSPEQQEILPEIAALMGAIVGYVDHIMDVVGNNLISSYGQLTEALRRRRVTTSESDRFVERLLGLELDQGLYDRGRTFVDGIVERAGEDGLAKLWESVETLPTPNELGSPGLWLSRMGVDFEVEIDPADLAGLDEFLQNPEEE
jgi:putative hydrolase